MKTLHKDILNKIIKDNNLKISIIPHKIIGKEIQIALNCNSQFEFYKLYGIISNHKKDKAFKELFNCFKNINRKPNSLTWF